MSEKEKYMAIIMALAEVIENKNNTIIIQEFQIKDLREKLKDAEAAAYADNGKGVEA